MGMYIFCQLFRSVKYKYDNPCTSPFVTSPFVSNEIIDGGNGKIYVPESIMEKDVAYTVTISK